ncbi:hypothetical protein [Paenibacillus sp. LK1]|uniref:hypothetical protein n=1 Tax=Paenibacillus sp. LK1 TaxID=2053014 RepID=UPI000C19EAA5|nr:hypothetical protein [Paenibacillus sp. LK1]PIH57523.1 hypothetical protein CS562_20175 [Paenibacillus sp. LK1]
MSGDENKTEVDKHSVDQKSSDVSKESDSIEKAEASQLNEIPAPVPPISSQPKRAGYKSKGKTSGSGAKYDKSNNRGISTGDLLEYRMKRLVFKMGYFPKVGVVIRTSQEDNADPITDLDVFGVYIHRDFSNKSIWVDCKSGQSRPHERISWIKGIQTTVNADDIIFVKSGVRITTKEYARKSGIQILDVNLIEKLEKDYDIKPEDWRGSWDYKNLHTVDTNFGKLKIPTNDVYKKISNFIKSDYWIMDDYSRIKKSITALRELSALVTLSLEEDQLKAIKWAIYELVGLFTMATLNILKEVYYFSDSEKKEIISERLISSDIPLSKRLELVDASFKIAYALLKQQFPDFVLPTSKQNVNLKAPSYFDAFYDVILRISNSPHSYYDVLRYLDFVLMEYDMKSKKVNEKEISSLFSHSKENNLAAKTLLHFLCQITGLPQELFVLLSTQLTHVNK